MGPRSAAFVALLLLWGSSAAFAAAPSGSPDELEPVRSAVRLKKFSEAAGKLQALATAGPPDPAAAQQWLARAREFGFSGAGGAAATQAAAPSTSLLPATQLTTPQ